MEFRGLAHDTTEAPLPLSVEDEPFLLREGEQAEFSPLEEQVIDLARGFASNAEKTKGRSMVIIGAGMNHWYH